MNNILFVWFVCTDIVIPLQYRIGQYLRIELTYHSEWLQMSEIEFDCHPLPLSMNNLTIDQKSKLFEWTHSEAYYNGAGQWPANGGTRYIMSDDNAALSTLIHDSNHGNHHQPNRGIQIFTIYKHCRLPKINIS